MYVHVCMCVCIYIYIQVLAVFIFITCVAVFVSAYIGLRRSKSCLPLYSAHSKRAALNWGKEAIAATPSRWAEDTGLSSLNPKPYLILGRG